MNAKQKSLVLALAWCDLKALPQSDTKESIWLRAIALVSKSDGSKNYAVYERDSDGNPKCIKDFGTICQIVNIDEIHPFYVLDPSKIPSFKGKFKDERIAWLKANGIHVNADDVTTKELDRMILNLSISFALKSNKLKR